MTVRIQNKSRFKEFYIYRDVNFMTHVQMVCLVAHTNSIIMRPQYLQQQQSQYNIFHNCHRYRKNSKKTHTFTERTI